MGVIVDLQTERLNMIGNELRLENRMSNDNDCKYEHNLSLAAGYESGTTREQTGGDESHTRQPPTFPLVTPQYNFIQTAYYMLINRLKRLRRWMR